MNIQYAFESVQRGKSNCFMCADLEHGAPARHGPVAKRHEEYAARCQKRSNNGHCSPTFLLIEMHPYSREHDQAEFVLPID